LQIAESDREQFYTQLKTPSTRRMLAHRERDWKPKPGQRSFSKWQIILALDGAFGTNLSPNPSWQSSGSKSLHWIDSRLILRCHLAIHMYFALILNDFRGESLFRAEAFH
jgi:hypothetical protein